MDVLMRKKSLMQKMARSKKSKSVKSDIAVHPFVIASIVAAVAIVVWSIVFYGWRLISGK
jgi:hypothetical protein